MPTYFKPLRRKLGVVTLVTACVFAAGWVRSVFVADIFQKEIATDPRFISIDYRCLSTDGILYLNREAVPISDEWKLLSQQGLWRGKKPNPIWRTLNGASGTKDALAEMK